MPGVLSVPVCRRRANAYPAEDLDLVAVEEPLQIRIADQDLAVTMRTPGEDAELAAGFLFTEGVLNPADIVGIACQGNTATVRVAPGVDPGDSILRRSFYVSSSCGVCGRTSIDAIDPALASRNRSDEVTLCAPVIQSLPKKLREAQRVFDRTGGLHACGLFDLSGELVLVREDIGRHNALDKVIGRAVLDDSLPLSERVLLVSGRASFELVQKAVMAGIPILAAVGAPSSLAVKTALRFQMTLIGFLRDDRFNVYSCPWRLDPQAA